MADRERPGQAGRPVGERAGTTLTEGRTEVRSSRPVAMRRLTSRGETTRDRVRWGPVWAGLVVTVATYVLLQLALFASGLIDANFAGGVNEGALLSAVVGIVAFFLGGLVTGATAPWRNLTDGALNAIVTWGLAIVALIVLSVLGGGFAAGGFGDLADQFDIDTNALEDVSTQEATEAAREASANALLGISLALAAVVVGGVAGAKMWPAGRDDEEVDLRDDVTSYDRSEDVAP